MSEGAWASIVLAFIGAAPLVVGTFVAIDVLEDKRNRRLAMAAAALGLVFMLPLLTRIWVAAVFT